MQRPHEALDMIARSGQAVFAMDPSDRIVLWNRQAEELLGWPAQKVLGKRCYDVLAGRDANGNIYCFRNCPVAFQAREQPEQPVEPFVLSVRTADGKQKALSVSMFAIPAVRASLSTVVHVVKKDPGKTLPIETKLAEASADSPKPLWPLESKEERVVDLTPREREILRCMAEGLTTTAIAKRCRIAPVTVRNHVQSILSKLDVHTKLAAVAFAYRNKLI